MLISLASIMILFDMTKVCLIIFSKRCLTKSLTLQRNPEEEYIFKQYEKNYNLNRDLVKVSGHFTQTFLIVQQMYHYSSPKSPQYVFQYKFSNLLELIHSHSWAKLHNSVLQRNDVLQHVNKAVDKVAWNLTAKSRCWKMIYPIFQEMVKVDECA